MAPSNNHSLPLPLCPCKISPRAGQGRATTTITITTKYHNNILSHGAREARNGFSLFHRTEQRVRSQSDNRKNQSLLHKQKAGREITFSFQGTPHFFCTRPSFSSRTSPLFSFSLTHSRQHQQQHPHLHINSHGTPQLLQTT